ncbi:hypothetical protein [Aquabacter spiritensis]|uniref:hypothetical protein n=1 Tax=Aquabacter spiritensis TaxID=933073 RepID=UPI00104D57CA|nr:hypothetical protein [Aquabacter spiritensis]
MGVPTREHLALALARRTGRRQSELMRLWRGTATPVRDRSRRRSQEIFDTYLARPSTMAA